MIWLACVALKMCSIAQCLYTRCLVFVYDDVTNNIILSVFIRLSLEGPQCLAEPKLLVKPVGVARGWGDLGVRLFCWHSIADVV